MLQVVNIFQNTLVYFFSISFFHPHPDSAYQNVKRTQLTSFPGARCPGHRSHLSQAEQLAVQMSQSLSLGHTRQRRAAKRGAGLLRSSSKRTAPDAIQRDKRRAINAVVVKKEKSA